MSLAMTLLWTQSCLHQNCQLCLDLVFLSNELFWFKSSLVNQSSLKLLQPIENNTSTSGYLLSNDGSFKAKELKLKMRLGILEIGSNLKSQKRSDGKCPMCGRFESTKHFLLQCPAYNVPRYEMFDRLFYSVPNDIFNNFICNANFATTALLGCHDDIFNKYFMIFISQVWSIRREHF